MALFSNLISFLFLTTLVLFSMQTNARDSQFFSKVTPLNNNNNNVNKETEAVPSNEGPGEQQQEEQPVFIPETTENSYGLYGHETGLNPPSTTSIKAVATTYQPQSYKTESDDTNKYYNFNKDGYFYNNNNNNNNKKDVYEDGETELSETNYNAEGEYKSMENQNNYNNRKYYYGNKNNKNNRFSANDKYFYSSNNNGASDKNFYNNNKGEMQGMSDTKFMEGGKYFYDLNSEKYNPKTHYDGSSRGINSDNNWSNSKAYFGFNNNANSNPYRNKNSMEGYQSQNVFEDDQPNFDP